MADLFAYLCGIARSEGFTLISAEGTANHVHLLLVLPATLSISTAVQKLKGSSSREGYGAFSVSPSQVATVKRYIAGQEEHHRKRSFEEEFTELLRECGLEHDSRFVFG